MVLLLAEHSPVLLACDHYFNFIVTRIVLFPIFTLLFCYPVRRIVVYLIPLPCLYCQVHPLYFLLHVRLSSGQVLSLWLNNAQCSVTPLSPLTMTLWFWDYRLVQISPCVLQYFPRLIFATLISPTLLSALFYHPSLSPQNSSLPSLCPCRASLPIGFAVFFTSLFPGLRIRILFLIKVNAEQNLQPLDPQGFHKKNFNHHASIFTAFHSIFNLKSSWKWR